MNYQRLLYSLIACHGITDICEKPEIWIPIYVICASYAPLFNYEVYLKFTIVMTALHFSQDLYDTLILHIFNIYLATLCFLLWFREWWISQQIIVGYLGLIHTPLHLYHKATCLNDTLIVCTWAMIYSQDWIIAYIASIIHDKAIETDTRLNRILLSVLNSHMIVHVVLLISPGFHRLMRSLLEMDFWEHASLWEADTEGG